jgi:teichoic acid transport system ATP-binding protein
VADGNDVTVAERTGRHRARNGAADHPDGRWSAEELAQLHRKVDAQAIKLGPPTPSRALQRQWKLRRSGVEDRVTMLVEDVHVTYRVYEDRRPRARDIFARGSAARAYREIKAVRGVSFEARAGEAIGFIGRNGSGKSTLMKAMAGLLPVESGRILAHSQPSLLGVGAVLQPGLSGRRNIILGTLALGLSKREAESKVDEITAFAGLEDFIDLPMRTYSSGMKARLHFSIATAVTPEILMIDEALAVGDEVFRRRSDARIRELQEAAGTIFLVSHSMDSIIDTCTRVFWLDAGTVIAEGDPEEVVEQYRARMAQEVGRDGARKRRKGAKRGKR